MKTYLVALSAVCLSCVGRVAAAPVTIAPSLVAPSTQAMNAATATEIKAFRKMYAAGDAATLRRDLAFMSRMLSDDFELQYQSGLTLDKAQYLRLTKQILQRTLKFNAVRTRIDRIGTQKNQAVVVSTSFVDMSYRGLDNKTHRSVSTSQIMDTWILTKQGWRTQSSQEIATRSTIDGRAYIPATQTQKNETTIS